MTEEFLHHLWKYRLFEQQHLIDQNGARIEILQPGIHNRDAGPDFFNAKVKIGETLWAGNVEIHTHASDWDKHKHEFDKAYSNVILHVVYDADKSIVNNTGECIPTIELKDKFDEVYLRNYHYFKTSKDWIPCEKQIGEIDDLFITTWLDRLLIERLERKSNEIKKCLKLNKYDWEETFYQLLARNFGFKVNADPFELLAKSLPFKNFAKQKNSLLQIEAMLFGQAGLLEEYFEDSYPKQLQNEFTFLKNKFRLQPIHGHTWKFLRLRPSNFPTIRIAQFARLIYSTNNLFSRIIAAGNMKQLNQIMTVEASTYWEDHYVFDKPSRKRKKSLGKSATHIIMINTIVPFLFVYGKEKDDEQYVELAISILEEIKGERNSITEKWESLKMPVENAGQTQALIQLKNEYCAKRSCLDCMIGAKLLQISKN